MEKTIKLSENESITLSNNAAWLYEFADQFGYDITPTLLPLANSLVESIHAVTRPIIEQLEIESKSKGKTTADAIEAFKALDKDAVKEAIFELFTTRATDFINIIWAMNKAADEDIEEPRRWIRKFDKFPLDILIPEAGSMIAEGFLSSKHLKRLQSMMEKVKTLEVQSIFTQSPSQESKEG